METNGNAVEKFLKVKIAAARESATNTIQESGRRTMADSRTVSLRHERIPRSSTPESQETRLRTLQASSRRPRARPVRAAGEGHFGYRQATRLREETLPPR